MDSASNLGGLLLRISSSPGLSESLLHMKSPTRYQFSTLVTVFSSKPGY